MARTQKENICRVFDEDGSGTIDFEEFIMISSFKNSTHVDKLGLKLLSFHCELFIICF